MAYKNPVDEQVGARLRMLLTNLGVSEDDLSKELGVSVEQIRKYEDGSQRIGAEMLLKISKFLGLTARDFFSEPPTRH